MAALLRLAAFARWLVTLLAAAMLSAEHEAAAIAAARMFDRWYGVHRRFTIWHVWRARLQRAQMYFFPRLLDADRARVTSSAA